MPKLSEARAYFLIDILTDVGYNKNKRSDYAKYMYCEAIDMTDLCGDCNKQTYCLEPCEQWLIQNDKCPVCQNKLIRSGGCTECITGDWAKCG